MIANQSGNDVGAWGCFHGLDLTSVNEHEQVVGVLVR